MNLQEAIQAARSGRTSSIRCSAHEDKSPSLSILPPKEDGWVRLKCHKGCSRDEILRAEGLDLKALAPDRPFEPKRNLRRSQRHKARPTIVASPLTDGEKADQRKSWPSLLAPEVNVLKRISAVRGLATEGLELAVERGILRVGYHRDLPCWFVTDDRRIAAQARRIDGQRFFNPDGHKSLSLTGTVGGWPIGAAAIRAEHRSILFCEGGPDLLAAHVFIWAEGRGHDSAAVAMLGASTSIEAEALSIFQDRKVRFICHADEAGFEAVARWGAQLRGIAVHRDHVTFSGLRKANGERANDLNDALLVDAETFEKARILWGLVP